MSHGRREILRSAPARSAAAALLLAVGPACSPRLERGLLIEGVTLVSPERAAPLPGTDVAVRDGRIVEIGRAIRAGAAVRRVDGRDRYLIPGLIDSHVHVGRVAALPEAVLAERPELGKAHSSQEPRSYLAFGFTAVVALDSTHEERSAFEAAPRHPRFFHCGHAARIPGGYGAQHVSPDRPPRAFSSLLYEPAGSARWPRHLDPSDHTPARVVDGVARSGGICVKTFIEPGFGLFDWPVPRPETLAALREETSRRGLRLVAHANGVEAWRAAIAARVDVIAHGLWHWPGDRLDPRPPAEVREVIAMAARAGTSVQPTLRVLKNERAIFDPSLLDDPWLEWSLPAGVIVHLRSPEAREARNALGRDYEKAAGQLGEAVGAAALLAAYDARALATVRLMAETGVSLLFGSDTPSGEGFGNPPGLNGRLELQHWAEAGVPLPRILRAATLDNAAAFGLSGELGTIEVGKRADLLLLRADPLRDVAAYDTVEIVFLDGEPLSRSDLRPVK